MDCANMCFRKDLLKYSEGCEVTSRHFADSYGDVAQVNEPLYAGAWPGKKREAAHRVQVRYELAHTCSSIACRSPLASRIHHLHLPHERQILGTVPILITEMAGDCMHHFLQHFWLQTFFPKEPLVKRNPLLQS